MLNKAVILPLEVWDRLIEVLDLPQHMQHQDTQYILTAINNQINPQEATTPLPQVTIINKSQVKPNAFIPVENVHAPVFIEKDL